MNYKMCSHQFPFLTLKGFSNGDMVVHSVDQTGVYDSLAYDAYKHFLSALVT